MELAETKKVVWLISAILREISHLRPRTTQERIPFLFNEEAANDYNIGMYHYNPTTALEELNEDATLPNPVHVRDMLLRRQLTPDQSIELNRLFVEYQKFFGETQKLGKEILKRLTA